MKRKIILVSLSSVSLVLLVSSLAIIKNTSALTYNAKEHNLYTLTFDHTKNKLTSNNNWSKIDSVQVELDSKSNQISFKSEGIKDNNNGWQSFNDGGYFLNTSHIIGMDSIAFNGATVSGESTATIYYSGEMIDITDLTKYKSQTLTFTDVTKVDQIITFDYKPNYILTKFVGQPVDIKSSKIIINNECRDFYSTVTINGLDNTMGSVSGAGIQYIGSEVTLKATPNPGYQFKGWFNGETLLTLESTYSFIQPREGITLTVKFEKVKIPKPNKGEIYKFGIYPQTHVSDNVLITSLNTLAGVTPDTNATGWTNCSDYYVNSTNDNQTARWFKDIEYNSIKYRAVYMTLTPNSNKKYVANKTHYFRFEPIEWTALDENGFIFSRYLLDSNQNYYRDYNNRETIDGLTISPNNYEHSDIRAWLNNSFLNNAFTLSDQSNILTTNVDNSGDSYGYPGNQYACNNTQDKLFLMSKNDVYDESYGFTTDNVTRQSKVTDYAQCMGCYADIDNGCGLYWLRSPYFEQPSYTYMIYHDGDWNGFQVDFYDLGVRPALKLDI